MKLSIIAAGTALLAVGGQTFADSNWYADVGYQAWSFDVEGDSIDFGSLSGHVGYKLSPNFAVEAEVGLGVKEHDGDFILEGDGLYNARLDYHTGLYGRLQTPIGDNTTIFARGGAVLIGTSEDVGGFDSFPSNDVGISVGAGVEHHFDGKNGLRLEYTRMGFEDVDADTFMIGYSRKF